MKIDDWRSRWVQCGKSRVLHRVRRIKNPRAWKDYPCGEGETVCGLAEKVWMPGFFSRLGARRCPKCCKALGIPKGVGAPFNDPALFPPEGKGLVSTSAPTKGEP